MDIRAKSEKGFSLIELLVVVAIIGVLAAVGVVGYQGYIDSTKKSVTDANAKAVHQWLVNTKTVRAAGIDTDPVACKSATLTSSTTANDAVASNGCFGQLGAAGGFMTGKLASEYSDICGSSASLGKSYFVSSTDCLISTRA